MIKVFLALISLAMWFSNWKTLGYQCAKLIDNVLVMECESSAVYSQPYDLDRPISIETSMMGYPIGSTKHFWVGLALNSNLKADDTYVEIAIEKGIAPYTNYENTFVVYLSTPPFATEVLKDTQPDNWHKVRIDYFDGVATYYVDDQLLRTVNVQLGDQVVIEFLCVAVDPGTVVKGALTHCEFTQPIVEFK